MWAAILPALYGAIASEGVRAGFGALSGKPHSESIQPVPTPQMQQPDILSMLLAHMKKQGGM